MKDVSSPNIAANEDVHGNIVHTPQPVTLSNAQETSQPRPKTFLSLPRELRDQIYELCFYCGPHVVVFAGADRPSNHGGPKDPEMTAEVASKHDLFYPGSFTTFSSASNEAPANSSQTTMSVASGSSPTRSLRHGMRSIYNILRSTSNCLRHNSNNRRQNDDLVPSSVIPLPTRRTTNWSKSLTGILYTNKQISSEAVPHLYHSCNFSFEDLVLAHKFLKIAGPTNLEFVRKISIYYPDELEVIYTPTPTIVDNSAVMQQMFQTLCEGIVKTMPKINELTVWIGKKLDLEYYGTRNWNYERALLQLAGLKEIEDLVVKKHGDAVDNSGDEEIRWEGDSNEFTVKGVKEMIATGDHGALDRMRRAFKDSLEEPEEWN